MSQWIVWEKSTESEQFWLGSKHCHLLAVWPWTSYFTSLYSALSSQKWNFLINAKSTYLRRMVGGTKKMICEMTKVSLHIRSPWVQGKEVGDRSVGTTVRKQEPLQLLPFPVPLLPWHHYLLALSTCGLPLMLLFLYQSLYVREHQGSLLSFYLFFRVSFAPVL